jgi:hypothetical protein
MVGAIIANEFFRMLSHYITLASIFKNPETPEIQYTTPSAVTAAYKVDFNAHLCGLSLTFPRQKYTIYRKLPMLVTRQERTLAVDGEWVHVHFFSFISICCHLLTTTLDHAIQ